MTELLDRIREVAPWGVQRWKPGAKLPATTQAIRWTIKPNNAQPFFSDHIEHLTPEQIAEALQRVCERCDGEGEYPFAPVAPHTPNPCPACHGTGKAEWQLYEFVTGLVKGLPAKP